MAWQKFSFKLQIKMPSSAEQYKNKSTKVEIQEYGIQFVDLTT